MNVNELFHAMKCFFSEYHNRNYIMELFALTCTFFEHILKLIYIFLSLLMAMLVCIQVVVHLFIYISSAHYSIYRHCIYRHVLTNTERSMGIHAHNHTYVKDMHHMHDTHTNTHTHTQKINQCAYYISCKIYLFNLLHRCLYGQGFGIDTGKFVHKVRTYFLKVDSRKRTYIKTFFIWGDASIVTLFYTV